MGALPDIVQFRVKVDRLTAIANADGTFSFTYDTTRVNAPVGEQVQIRITSQQAFSAQYAVGQQLDITLDQV